MNDPTSLPTAEQSAALLAAYRVWVADGDSDDDAMAAAMFANLPAGLVRDDERCVTVDGFALVAQRNPLTPAGVVYDLESYAIDAELGDVSASEVIDLVAAPAAPAGDPVMAAIMRTPCDEPTCRNPACVAKRAAANAA